MKRLFLVLAFLVFYNDCYADSLYCDDYGFCSGTVNGEYVHTYTDDYGFTTGSIGDNGVNTYTDD